MKTYFLQLMYPHALAKDWTAHFGLTGDPFDTLPLQEEKDFRTLFVRTEDVKTYIDPMIGSFRNSRPVVRCIAGPRGSGKSTLLYYIESEIRRDPSAMVVHVRHQRQNFDTIKDPKFGVGVDTLNGVLRELAIAVSQSGFQDPGLRGVLKAIGGVLEDSSDDDDTEEVPEWSYSRRMPLLEKLLGYVGKPTVNRGIIAIDNYDKNLDQELALEFLRSAWAQSLFEKVQGSGFSIFLSANLEWGKRIATEPDLNYLGQPIFLRDLNPSESTLIVEHRLKAKSTAAARFPFDGAAMGLIALKKSGVPREIMETCRLIMIEAAKKNRQLIDENFVREFFRSEEEKGERYYDLIRPNSKAEAGFTFLNTIRQQTDSDAYRKLLSGLAKHFNHEKIEPEMMDQLREKRLMMLAPSLKDPSRRELLVNSEVDALLQTIQSKYSLNRFVDWMAKGSDVSLLIVPSVEEQEKRQSIDLEFQHLEELFRGYPTIYRSLNDSLSAYRSLVRDVDQNDFEMKQIIQGIARCVYRLSEAVFRANSTRNAATPQNIQSLLEKNPLTRKIVADYVVIRSLEDITRRGLPVGPSELTRLQPRFENILEVLLFALTEAVPGIEQSEPHGLMPLTIRDGEQFYQKISPYLKNPEHVILVTLLHGYLHEFSMLCWQFGSWVYALPCGEKTAYRERHLDPYELKTKLDYQIPSHVKHQLRIDSLSYLTMLRYYNINEFAQSVLSMSQKTPMRLAIVTKSNTVSFEIKSAQYGDFEATFRLGPSRWGQTLSRLQATEPPRRDLKTQAFPLMRQLEENLNTLVLQRLSATNSKWWDEDIPKDIQEDCEGRKLRGQKSWPWYEQPDLPLISYLTFADYRKIIDRNWPKFLDIFGDKIVLFKLEELEPLRNNLMHSTVERQISPKDFMRLELYHKDLMKCMTRPSNPKE